MARRLAEREPEEDVGQEPEEVGQEPEEEHEEEPEEVAEGDPYATGGLLRRLRRQPRVESPPREPERNYSSFDWRGRPLD